MVSCTRPLRCIKQANFQTLIQPHKVLFGNGTGIVDPFSLYQYNHVTCKEDFKIPADMLLSLRSALQFQNTEGRALLHQRFVTVLTADSFSICSQSHTKQYKTFPTSLPLVTMIINDYKNKTEKQFSCHLNLILVSFYSQAQSH